MRPVSRLRDAFSAGVATGTELALRSPRNEAPVPLVSDIGGGLSGLLGGGTSGTADPAGQMGLMGSVGTLFAIVDGSATSVSLVDWKLFPKGLTEEERKPETEIRDHPAKTVLDNPNPFTTRQELFEVGQQHQDLTGETWLLIARRGEATTGPPVELWNVRPDRMSPVPHPTEFIAGYVYASPDGDTIPLMTSQVMMIRLPNPMDPYRGMAPIQAVMDDADAIRYATAWQKNFFINSAEPGGIIRLPDGKILSDTEFQKLKLRWRQQHRGVANAHRVAILEGGMEWVDRKYTVRDMMFTDLRGLSSEQIREAYRFPKPILGTVEDVNRANAEAAELVYGRWFVRPRLERWRQMLNHDFLPMFPGGDRLEFCYDRAQIEPENRELENATLTAKVAAFVQLASAGVPPQLAADAVGLPLADLPAVSEDTIGRREKMELVQKVYLGVGTVITAQEARRELAEAGWDIKPEDWPDDDTEPQTGPDPAALPAGNKPLELEPAPDDQDAEQQAQAARWRAQARLLRAQEGATPVPASESNIPGRAEVDAATDRLLADWEDGVLTSWIDQVTRTVETNGNDETALRESSLPTTYAIDLLTNRMDEQYRDGADQLWQDARGQGVEADDLEDVDDPELRDQAEADVGAIAAAWLDRAVLALRQAYAEQAAGPETNHLGALVIRNVTNTEAADRVRAMLEEVKAAGARSKLTSSLHAARNQGRIAQARKAPKATYVALEESDSASCDACRDVDGHEFRNLAAAERAYKTGGYSKCAGRERCRGTFDARWD